MKQNLYRQNPLSIIGDKIPADGVILESNKLNIDESLHNGVSDNVKKSVESCPVVFTGTNVVGGDGRILITAVGLNTNNGIVLTLLRAIEDNLKNKKNKSSPIKSNIKNDEENLQPLLGNNENFKNGNFNSDTVLAKLEEDLSKKRYILRSKVIKVFLQCCYFSLFFATLYVILNMIHLCFQKFYFSTFKTSYLVIMILTLLTGLDIILTTLPEGFPFAVMLSVEYSAIKMMGDNYLIKELDYSETLGNVTNICFDKTGTLTNKSDAGQTLCDDVPKTISVCQQAGIDVRMVTGDNIITARSVAMSCGILKPGDDYLVLEAKEFNERIRDIDGELSQEKLDQIWPKLRVLADAKPIDKYNLVKGIIDSKINKNREIVAFVGDGTNDCLALKRAHVGVVMAKSSTYLAKEASDLIITDDNFNSLIKAIFWGRHIYDSITKILQFNLTVFFVEIVISVIGTLLILDTVLKFKQLIWVNIFISIMGSLALAADPPKEDLLNRKPLGWKSPLISKTIKKNIIGQTIYQLICLFVLIFNGHKFFGIESDLRAQLRAPPGQHFTIVFNTFVMLTLFNIINCRKIHGERNVFKDLSENILFCTLWITAFIFQILFIEFGGYELYTEPLTLEQWLYCTLFGACSLGVAQIINTIPPKD
uniref:Uncharacterized protein n=1 Tax=Meloidogyne enterolobii TaxID=390850 RepID=A0A6V7WJB9_MELEN|nr:unnamed protein product [Meloidogyne enterolobii]